MLKVVIPAERSAVKLLLLATLIEKNDQTSHQCAFERYNPTSSSQADHLKPLHKEYHDLDQQVGPQSAFLAGRRDADEAWKPRAGLAQLVEHLICNQGATGSNPVAGTITYPFNFNTLRHNE